MPGGAVPVAVPELAVTEDREDLELVDGPRGGGRRPGQRPCDGGGPLASNLMPAPGRTMAGENEEPKKP